MIQKTCCTLFNKWCKTKGGNKIKQTKQINKKVMTLDVDSSILSRRDSRQKLMQTARKLKSADRLIASSSKQTVEKYERRNLKTFVSNQILQRKKFTRKDVDTLRNVI